MQIPQASRRCSESSTKRPALYPPHDPPVHGRRRADRIDSFVDCIMHERQGVSQEVGCNTSAPHSSAEEAKLAKPSRRMSSVSAHSVHSAPRPTHPTSLSHRIDPQNVTNSEDREPITQSAIWDRIAETPTITSAPPAPSHPSVSQLASGGLRDRLSFLTSASTGPSMNKSLLERTIPIPTPPPVLQLVPRSPAPTPTSDLRNSSRPAHHRSATDRGLSPRSSVDWRRTSYSSHPKRRVDSRSRSPVGRRGRGSPPPFSAGSRGRSPHSPRHRYARTRYSRSPPMWDHRRSPPRGPRGYRRPLSPPRSVSSQRRSSQLSPVLQAGIPCRSREPCRLDVSSSHPISPANITTQDPSRTDRKIIHAFDNASLRIAPSIKQPNHVSILVSNLPSNPKLTPRDVYMHITRSSRHIDLCPPYELTLYRFAGTARVCGELSFHSEEAARAYEKTADRHWKLEWASLSERPTSESIPHLEFIVVDRDRTPWPGYVCLLPPIQTA